MLRLPTLSTPAAAVLASARQVARLMLRLLACTVSVAVVVASDPSSSGGDGPAADDATPPNFVLVLADDQGWGDVGYNAVPERTYNGTVLNPPKTPHIDAMASSPHSLVFHRFYVSTHCTAARRLAEAAARTEPALLRYSPHSLVFHRLYVRTAPPHAAGWLRLPHVLTTDPHYYAARRAGLAGLQPNACLDPDGAHAEQRVHLDG
eukprot:COSAG06_NODE_1261_length_10074_cov_21.232882_1_plen_206_part_00